MPALAEAKRRATELGWLSRQPSEFRDAVLARCELRTYEIGESLYRLDDPPGGIFGLTAGFVDVLLGSSDFPPFLAFVGRTGWWVGEAAAITGSPRRVQIYARTTAQVLHLPTLQLERLGAEDPSAWRRIAQLTVSHMDNALMLAATLMQGDPRDRVLATLHRLAGAMSDKDEVIDLPCMQSEIAEMAGLSRNSVGPVMRCMRKECLIQASRGLIRYNPVKIQRALTP